MVVLHQLFDLDDNGRIEEKAFSNGDVYVGRFQGTLPHGKGKYAWSDGTVYDGDWEEGKMTGKGQMLWPSRAKYEGDFAGGYIHGIGTLNGHDGSEYRGSWRMNIQHGVGKKLYPNLDVYEGSWKEGLQGGSGRYCWNNGNMYIGEWKAGTICGRGVMKWLNGDLYDGFWSNGLRHGSGVYRFTDGSYYFGTWSKGLKDGKGTFYPAGTKLPSFRNLTNSLSSRSLASCPSLRSEEVMDGTSNANHICSEKLSAGEKSKNSGHRASRTCSFNENCSLYDLANESVNLDPSLVQPHPSDESQNEMQENGSTMVYEREYTQGVLIKETIRDAKPGQKAKQKNKFTSVQETKKKSRVDIFEGRRSYYLMLNLQLGIRYTVGKITPVPRREVRSSDFGERARIRMYFPRKGSKFTPPHKSGDFFWKDYCPMVFRNLREMFKLDAAEYMMSICGDDGLREICTPGKSGCLFYVSHDDRFVIKTLKKHELKCLLKILPSYYAHVKTYENTLITKYFGVHRIKLRAGKKVRFIVMGNMFFTELKIHRRYDLKGSTEGRFTEKEKIGENTTLKDCDLEYEFHMDKLLRESLLHQLSVDSKFLESQQIIDYSLLLGLHFRAPERLSAILETQSTVVHQESSSAIEGGSSRELLIPPKGLLLVTHEPSFVSTAPGPHIRGSTLRAFSVGEKEVDLILPGTARLRVQLGVHMPAQANHKLTQQDDVDSSEVELFEVYDVVLYLGLIDILQEYNMVKKVEHAYKSLKYDPQKISVVDPKLYSKRFLSFMQRVFLEQ